MKLWGALAVVVLAVAGVIVGLVAFGGGSSSTALPKKGPYSPLTVPTPTTPLVGGVFLGDPEEHSASDLQMIVSPGRGPRHFTLSIVNTSGIGYVNSFQWYPPPGVTVLSVTGSSQGRCSMSGTSGLGGNLFKTVVLDPNISCTGVSLKPPTCTCRGDGGSMTVSFVADKSGILPGAARVVSMTPVLKIVPSYVPPADK
ncbi:MAG: hypothetical protein JO064_02335 [Actinobacteria bacterium]|nr:hypothetical protein [Actinomycetota bacterium]MBV8598581.1 hypothetical protein [Actinomycetota bacterium]